MGYPIAGQNPPPIPIAVACQGFGWVDFAVEDDDARIGRWRWRTPVVGRPSGDAVVFKASAPVGRPVLQLAFALHPVREIGLFVAEFVADLGKVSTKLGQQFGVAPQFKTVNG